MEVHVGPVRAEHPLRPARRPAGVHDVGGAFFRVDQPRRVRQPLRTLPLNLQEEKESVKRLFRGVNMLFKGVICTLPLDLQGEGQGHADVLIRCFRVFIRYLAVFRGV